MREVLKPSSLSEELGADKTNRGRDGPCRRATHARSMMHATIRCTRWRDALAIARTDRELPSVGSTRWRTTVSGVLSRRNSRDESPTVKQPASNNPYRLSGNDKQLASAEESETAASIIPGRRNLDNSHNLRTVVPAHAGDRELTDRRSTASTNTTPR